jgi:ribosomal protein S18 acetylase RimI-like enzyme
VEQGCAVFASVLLEKSNGGGSVTMSGGAQLQGDAQTKITIRRLTSTDAAIYRDIRLEGLRDSSEAFGSTFEIEGAKPLEWFAERIGSCEVFGAFQGAELVGVAGLLIDQGLKEKHKAYLWGMYVRSGARKAGAGRRLVEALLEFGRTRVELIKLAVVSGNVGALRLYASMGFVQYGLEKKSLKQNGRYYDEILMVKEL